jgi:hypothetical protein
VNPSLPDRRLLIAGFALLLIVLLGLLLFVGFARAIPRVVLRQAAPPSPRPPTSFDDRFTDELTRLNEFSEDHSYEADEVELPSTVESADRMAARLGIVKADAELLVRIEEAREKA